MVARGGASRPGPAEHDRAGLAAVWLVGLAPLAVIPGGAFAFVLGKLLVVALAVGVATWATAAGRLPRAVVWWVMVGAVWLVVAALTSSAPLAALAGRWPRYEGLVALPVYSGAAWAGARLLGPSARSRRWRSLHAALATTALLMALVAALELLGVHPLGGEGMRPGSFQGNATELGLLGAVLLGVLAVGALSERRWWAWAGALGAVVMVAASGSRAAYLAVAVVVLVAVLGSRSSRRWWPVGGVAAVALAVLAVPGSRERLIATATVEGRAILWQETFRLVGAHPALGVGPSGFVDAIVPWHTEVWAERVGMHDPPDSAHMWLLQAAAAGGVVLVAVALAVIVLAGRATWRAMTGDPARRALLVGPVAAVLGYGVGLLTHFTAGGTTPLVAFLAGACMALAPAPARAPSPARAPAATPAATPARAALLAGRAGWPSADPAGRPALVWRIAAGVLTVVLAAAAAAEWPVAAAMRAMNRGDVASVARDLDTARALRPWDVDLVSQGTQVFAALASAGVPGAADRAVAWGAAAHSLVPESMQAGLAYAVGLRLAEHSAQADDLLTVLHERSPFDPDVLIQLGVVARGVGDLASAREALTRAAELDPTNSVPWRQLVLVEQAAGDLEAAARAQNEADRLQASSP